MRCTYIIPQGMSPTLSDIQNACGAFYHNFKTHPDTVKMNYFNYSQLFLSAPSLFSPQFLEKGKEYGVFIPTPSGMVELISLDESEEQTTGSVLIVESNKVDREFEKHVLRGE